jgi:hypothetical protein
MHKTSCSWVDWAIVPSRELFLNLFGTADPSQSLWIPRTPSSLRFLISRTPFPKLCHTFWLSMMIIILSMGWDYVSEQRPPTSLLFIPQVIYEHWEPWRNDIHRVELLIRPPELSEHPTSRWPQFRDVVSPYRQDDRQRNNLSKCSSFTKTILSVFRK